MLAEVREDLLTAILDSSSACFPGGLLEFLVSKPCCSCAKPEVSAIVF